MSDYQPPKPGTGDVLHGITKAGFSLIPGLGGAASELFGILVLPPLRTRTARWMEDVGKAIKELMDRHHGITIDDLQNNDQFVTALLQATQIAAKNNRKEKIEALKNCVLNSVLNTEPDEDLQLIFLRYVDELAPRHIRVLAYFQNPEAWFAEHPPKRALEGFMSPKDGAIFAFDEFRGRVDFLKQIVADLTNRGLLDDIKLTLTMSPTGALSPHATDIGNRFLAFIKSPP